MKRRHSQIIGATLGGLFLVFVVLQVFVLPGRRQPNLAERFEGEDIALASNGDILVTGSVLRQRREGGEQSDMFVNRYDPSGELVWSKLAGGPRDDAGLEVEVLSGGDVVVVGNYNGGAVFGVGETGETLLDELARTDLFLARLSPSGQLESVRRVAGSEQGITVHLAATKEADVTLAGAFARALEYEADGRAERLQASGVQGRLDIFRARVDPSGELRWVRRAGSDGVDMATDVTLSSNGESVVVGSFSGAVVFGRGEEHETELTTKARGALFVARYDDGGALLWAKASGGPGSIRGPSISSTAEGGVVVSDEFTQRLRFDPGGAGEVQLESPGSWNVFLAKYDATGQLEWSRVVAAGNDRGGCRDVVALSDGSIAIMGNFSGSVTFGPGDPRLAQHTAHNGQETFIARFDEEGHVLWSRVTRGEGQATGRALAYHAANETLTVVGALRGAANFADAEEQRSTIRPRLREGELSTDLFLAQWNVEGELLWVTDGR